MKGEEPTLPLDCIPLNNSVHSPVASGMLGSLEVIKALTCVRTKRLPDCKEGISDLLEGMLPKLVTSSMGPNRTGVGLSLSSTVHAPDCVASTVPLTLTSPVIGNGIGLTIATGAAPAFGFAAVGGTSR